MEPNTPQSNKPRGCTSSSRPGALEPGRCGFTMLEEGVTALLDGCAFWEGGILFLGVMPPPSPRSPCSGGPNASSPV